MRRGQTERNKSNRFILIMSSNFFDFWDSDRTVINRTNFHLDYLLILLTSVSKSDEEAVEEVGEPVSKVLNDIDPERWRFLTSPTLTFRGCKPRGQPSSYNQINQKDDSWVLLQQNRQTYEQEKLCKARPTIRTIMGKWYRNISVIQMKERERERERAREDKWIPVQPCCVWLYSTLRWLILGKQVSPSGNKNKIERKKCRFHGVLKLSTKELQFDGLLTRWLR
jgi:hypothetical protein